MKRPVLIAMLGFITGIIWGLYMNIVSFIFGIVNIYLFHFLFFKKYYHFTKLIKLWLNKKTIILLTVTFIVGNTYILYLENSYQKIYQNLEEVKIIGTVISDKREKQYSDTYLVKVETINQKKIHKKNFWVSMTNKKIHINYGDKIYLRGEYIKPKEQRNDKGFDESIYLKSIQNYGTIKQTGDVKVLKSNQLNIILLSSHYIRNRIIENVNTIFPEETKGIFLGILLGYTDLLPEEVKQNFSDSSLSHLLAVSGMHVAYIVLGVTFLLQKMKISKKARKILTCLFLIFYLYLTNFTASVTRAVIMNIISIMQFNFYRKQDTPTTISISLLLILINNPYSILNIGFLLSYAGTIGIIVFLDKIKNILHHTDKSKTKKIIEYFKNIVLVTISAQIMILPITIYYFNTISFTFLVSNLVAGILIGPITILGLIIILISFINIPIVCIIGKVYNILLISLLNTTNFISKISLSKVYVKTPSILMCIVYYVVVVISILMINIHQSSRKYLRKKVKKITNKIKNIVLSNKKRILTATLFILIIIVVSNQIPKNLKIYFVDVGQGDCSLIITPTNKKILIDGGGSESYDVGENILLPYLLDRGITKLDYVFVSHCDTDHVRTGYFLLCKK